MNKREEEKRRRQEEKLIKERARLEKLHFYEKQYENYEYICGIDEVGRGPLAGPVVAGAVILPKDCEILYIKNCLRRNVKHCTMRLWRKRLLQG